MVSVVEDSRRRTAEVRVKLSPGMAERFAGIADGRGVLPATLAALAIGEYVEKYEQTLKVSNMVAMDASRRIAETMGSPDAMSKVMANLFADPALVRVFAEVAAETEGGAGQAGSSAGPEAAAVPPGCAGGAPAGADRARTAT